MNESSSSSSSQNLTSAGDASVANLQSRIPLLTATNYSAWLPRVDDFLYKADCEEIFKKSLAPNGVEQTGRCHPDVPKANRKASWYAIRSSLSDETIATHPTPRGEVEDLLRKIRLSFYKADTSFVDVLLLDMQEFQLTKHKDAQAYVNYASLTFSRLRDIGETASDRVQVYNFARGLPVPDYAVFKQLNSDKRTFST